jgi:hypothetical protein
VDPYSLNPDPAFLKYYNILPLISQKEAASNQCFEIRNACTDPIP